MIGAAKRYEELLTTLLVDRELAGGTLPEEVESHHVEELDRCWWAMTREEQQAVELRLTEEQRSVTAPETLGVEDVHVAQGEHVLPRRAA
jgi:hypothetical protein